MQPGLADTTIAPARARAARRPCGRGCRSRGRAGAPRTRRPRRNTVRRRRSRRACTPAPARFVPRRARAARAADDRGPARRPSSTSDAPRHALLDDPLGEVADARAERLGLGGAEHPAVVLHDRAAARAVHDDRRGPGHRRDHAARQPLGLARAARVNVQRAAAVATAAGRATSAPAARMTRTVDRWVSRSHASITQPVKHHADGSPPRGASSGVASERADRCGQAEPAGQHAQSLEQPSRPRHREQQPVHRQQQPVGDPLGVRRGP